MNNTDKIHKSFIIFSVDNNFDDILLLEHKRENLEQELKQVFNYKLVEGCYKGKTEVSFYVEIETVQDFNLIENIAHYYKQESILFVNDDRQAYLVYLDDTSNPVYIGNFKQVSKSEALQHDAYTYDYKNNGYYICE